MTKAEPDATAVLVATPAGAGGQGGVARHMQTVRRELDRRQRTDVTVEFRTTRGPGHVALSPLYLAGFLARMVAARLGGRLDVVHLNVASYGSTYRKLVIAALARLMRVPYVIHLHGAVYRRFWSGAHPARSRLIRSMFANAARIVVLGQVWREFVAGKVPEAAERIVVLPNAVPAPALPHRGGGDVVHILFLGRLEDRKGVPELVDALAGMADQPGWRATIAGDGEVDVFRARVAEKGLADRVTLPGWVEAPEVAELIASADILVLPSHDENLPISIIEAMAAGLAVVATPVGSVPDIVIDNETGLVVPAGDVWALGRALARLAGDKELRRRLGESAKALHRARLDIGPHVEVLAGIWKGAAKR